MAKKYLKEYKKDLVVALVVLIVLYVLPLNVYFTNEIGTADYTNLVFVINPITIFIASVIHSRYGRPFFIMPIFYSALFLPLVFALFAQSYLYCVFIYVGAGILGGLLGFWFHDKADVVKSLKKAVGISSIVFSIFAFLVSIIDKIVNCLDNSYCNYAHELIIGNLNVYICIAILILLGTRCLKKKKKKKKKED